MRFGSSKKWFFGSLAAAFLVLNGAAIAGETESLIARGGRLYDTWYKENKAEKPADNHPAYANKAGEYGGADSWRCKECHGWDNKGKDGAYSKGKHFTGIVGITGSAGKDVAAIAAMLRTGPHNYTEKQLSDVDVQALAMFVSTGQVDLSKYINGEGKPIGDGAKGEAYFNTLCAGCHGADGKKIKEAPLGAVAGNTPEMMHKVLNGQPGEAMPALRALDHQIAADITVHLQTLPE